MKLKNKIAAISSAAALAVAAWAIPAYATPADTNKADYWETYDFEGVDFDDYDNVMCVKFEDDEASNYGEIKTADTDDMYDGKTYVELSAAPGDYVYLALIIKGGNDDTGGNKVYVLPSVGTPYFGPIIGENVKDVSHWIICMGEPTGGEEESYVCGWVEGEPTMLPADEYPNLPPWQEDGDNNGCGEPEEQEYNYCDVEQRPAGMSVAEWLAAGEFEGIDCFEFTPTLECGSFDWTVDEQPAGFTSDYVAVYLMADDPLVTGGLMPASAAAAMALPATFPEDYNGGSVQIAVWLQGPEADYLTGSGYPNYWDDNPRMVTIDTDCLPPSSGELPVEVEAELTGMCIGDTPWIMYDIEVNDPGEQLAPGAKATIAFTDPNHPGEPTPWEVDFGTGYLLWPGAEIELADGYLEIDPTDPNSYVITNWPGWQKAGDGWVLVAPGQYGWTLTAAGVPFEVTVNPTVTGTLFYPADAAAPDSNNCVPPEQTTVVLSDGPPTATPSYTG